MTERTDQPERERCSLCYSSAPWPVCEHTVGALRATVAEQAQEIENLNDQLDRWQEKVRRMNQKIGEQSANARLGAGLRELVATYGQQRPLWMDGDMPDSITLDADSLDAAIAQAVDEAHRKAGK